MTCSKCGSTNVVVTNEVKMVTFGLIIIIPLLTNSKVKSKNKTVAICQNCGNRWYP